MWKKLEMKYKVAILIAIITAFGAIIAAIINKPTIKEPSISKERRKNIELLEQRLSEFKKYEKKLNKNKIAEYRKLENKNVDDFRTLYEIFNQELTTYLDSVFCCSKSRLLYLSASAGSGKSTFFNDRFGKPLEDSRKLYKFEYYEYYKIDDERIVIVVNLKRCFSEYGEEADLIKQQQQQPINMLPGTRESVFFVWEEIKRLTEKENTLLVLDGIDEISNNASKELLRKIDEFLEEKKEGFEIIVLGRQEGFKAYLNERRNKYTFSFKSLTFNTPIYHDEKYLKILHENHSKWRQNTRGEKTPDFKSLQKLLVKKPFLREDLSLLMLTNSIIINSEKWYKTEDYIIKDVLLSEILERNQRTHQRPPILNENYLASIAKALVEKIDLTETGYRVSVDACVDYADDIVNVLDLLSRSGLIYFDPTDNSYFHFIPSWVPSHIVEKHLKNENAK